MPLDEWIEFIQRAGVAAGMLGGVIWILIEYRGNSIWVNWQDFKRYKVNQAEREAAAERLERERWDPIRESLGKINESLVGVAERLARIESTNDSVDKRLGRLETQVDGHDHH